MELVVELAEELIEEILVRANFKDMLNSKSVCKSWRALISDPIFLQFRRQLRSSSNKHPSNSIRLLLCSNDFTTDMHGHEFAKKELYLFRSDRINNNATLEGKSDRTLKLTLQHKREVTEQMKVISSSFLELVLLYTKNVDPVYVYNPSTEDFLSLPKNPDWEKCYLSSMGFGRINSTNEYKVVRVFEGLHDLQCEVFTLGSDDHWRSAAAPPYDISKDASAFAAGGVYMFLNWVSPENYFARFDIEHEQWTTLPKPEGCLGNGDDLFISEVGGLLCLIDNSRWSVDMWVLEDYKQGVWVLKNRINFYYFSNFFDEEEYQKIYPLSLDYGNGKVLLVWDEYNVGRKLISYDPKTHNVKVLQILHPSNYFTATLFTENFGSLF